MLVHGEGELLVPAHLNFGKYVLDRLRKAKPHRLCFRNCTRNDQLTYAAFTQHAVRVASALAQRVVRGDTVAVMGEPRATLLPTGLGIMLAGATYTPIPLDCGTAVLTHKLTLTKPKYAFCSRLFWETHSDVLKKLDFIKSFICFDGVSADIESLETFASNVDVDVDTYDPVRVNGATDVAMILYSSGTTGLCKGLQHTHLNCIAQCDPQWWLDFESLETVYFAGSHLCGAYGIFRAYPFLCAGKTIVNTEDIHVDLKVIQDYKANTIPTIPALVDELINAKTEEYDLSSLKVIISATAPLLPSLAEAFSKKVVDVETRAILGPNQRGEICVRGPRVMKGYLGVPSPIDEEGFYLTGDLGYFDDKKHFYHLDRLKDIILSTGYTVSPGEVEVVLLGHPAVLAAAVVGKPAEKVTEKPTAFVVLRPGASATEAELVNFVDPQVPWYMRLTGGVRFIAELPMSPENKILRRKLKETLIEEAKSEG
ncbi:luciferin 4-monooxygenase-like [Cydia fagiglandana]|uniref:luciferin 4-monooxygenase-like n=1 Tax=Cydia fagiglandana TaxID=1458189 RepID=UPI002FEDFC27